MKKITQFIVNCSIIATLPMVANAAGTYYNGGYQTTQQRYTGTGYQPSGQTYTQNTGYRPTAYNQNQYSQYTPVGQQRVNMQQTQQRQQPQNQQQRKSAPKSGLYMNAGMSYETASWDFEMKESGSMLHYNDVNWMVFDVNAGYNFSAGNTPMQIDAGFKYGIQSGETQMIDDDITNGGYFITQWVDVNDDIIGNQFGHALSVGTSDGGNMMGFNVGFGLTDFFKWGNARITPSVGYRYFKHKLETKKNYGLALDTAACFDINGEIQCDPAIIIKYGNGQQIIWRDQITDPMAIGNGAVGVNPGGTYYYQQPGTSHSYETTWAGPYVAMDVVYDINQNNSVDARLEIGMPGYTSEGDQPYRFDWQHPKSVEDKAGMFSAFNIGFGANWRTALTDTVMLSIGLTYNYYSVKGADATTYLNGNYYVDLYNEIMDDWTGTLDELLATGSDDAKTVQNILDTEEACPGWVCKQDGEVDSFYKSMGIRVGLSARF